MFCLIHLHPGSLCPVSSPITVRLTGCAGPWSSLYQSSGLWNGDPSSILSLRLDWLLHFSSRLPPIWELLSLLRLLPATTAALPLSGARSTGPDVFLSIWSFTLLQKCHSASSMLLPRIPCATVSLGCWPALSLSPSLCLTHSVQSDPAPFCC